MQSGELTLPHVRYRKLDTLTYDQNNPRGEVDLEIGNKIRAIWVELEFQLKKGAGADAVGVNQINALSLIREFGVKFNNGRLRHRMTGLDMYVQHLLSFRKAPSVTNAAADAPATITGADGWYKVKFPIHFMPVDTREAGMYFLDTRQENNFSLTSAKACIQWGDLTDMFAEKNDQKINFATLSFTAEEWVNTNRLPNEQRVPEIIRRHVTETKIGYTGTVELEVPREPDTILLSAVVVQRHNGMKQDYYKGDELCVLRHDQYNWQENLDIRMIKDRQNLGRNGDLPANILQFKFFEEGSISKAPVDAQLSKELKITVPLRADTRGVGTVVDAANPMQYDMIVEYHREGRAN